MPELGNFAGAILAPLQYEVGTLVDNPVTTLAFNVADTGWCARVMATDTRDIKSVALNFSAVTAPGTATLRIETIDNSSGSGKPSSVLYDINATKQFTPTTGWNIITFDSLPTSGLIPGNQYGVVLIKDNSGTTCTLRSYVGNAYGGLPVRPLHAANASTRSNFSEIASSAPVAYFILEDDALVSMGCVPAVSSSSTAITNADTVLAQKIVLPCSVVARGVKFTKNTGMIRAGTPTGDLRMRVLDSSNVAVSGTTIIMDKDTLTNINTKGMYIPFASVTMPSGTYRIAFDIPTGANPVNNFGLAHIILADSSFQGSGFSYSSSTDASTAFTWTDNPLRMLPFGLELDSISVV